jgi:uncharacterized delta-60 repeat protein
MEVAMPVRSTGRPSLIFIGVAALVIGLASPAAAPPGDLDPTFDGDGKVTTDFDSSTDQANGVALQADGKIVAAGLAIVSGNFDFGLARYNTDGSLDITFDGDGKVATDFAGGLDQAIGVAVQPDGKIVTAGHATVSGTSDFAIARYNPDGSLDSTFDLDGKVTTDFGGDADEGYGVAIQADGKIVAAGWGIVSGTLDFAIARYNPDGSLDTTFDLDGKVTTDFDGSNDEGRAMAIQADGKIVAAGLAIVSGTLDFGLARYNPDGSLDTTFSGDGKVTTDFGSNEEGFGVAIQGDGKIVTAGRAPVSGTSDFALARYNANGSLDTTLSGDGRLTTDFALGFDLANAVAIQANGKIVAAGLADSDFALARYNTDGSLDTTFNVDGRVTTDFAGSTDDARAVAIQANGRIVAAGRAFISGNPDFALARYTCFRRTSRPMSIPICS